MLGLNNDFSGAHFNRRGASFVLQITDEIATQSYVSTQMVYLSKSKDTLLKNDFGKSESPLLEYNLSESLKVDGTYCTQVPKYSE